MLQAEDRGGRVGKNGQNKICDETAPPSFEELSLVPWNDIWILAHAESQTFSSLDFKRYFLSKIGTFWFGFWT